MNKFDLLSLGEIMLRLSPPMNERLTRGNSLEKNVGGAELNVLSGVAQLGLRTGVISKVPANDIGEYAKNGIRFVGVSDDYLLFDTSKDARLGIYFYENGAYPRKPRICYDRAHSSIQKIVASEFPADMYTQTKCFHTTGITLALCHNTKQCAIEMMKKFKDAGALISFDVNFRSNLWSGDQARECINQILPLVDIFFCSDSTARLTFNKEGDTKDILRSFANEYDISIVAATNRLVHSPKLHSFTSIIYKKENDDFYEEKPYHHIDVVDRIGSGDAYISGVLYGLLKYNMDAKAALEFGNATASVKNTIPGDLQSLNKIEIEQIIESHKSEDASLEMIR
ncbi:sugar kinase [Candidatus Epulonipiscium viviparus]|uniref:sugar kinase n=1 Tax=Candidatus Epulonipiscium viviparus TaxID=420336 RepID=UPI0027380F1C|nr:sugar kinase [Candidatus Epulopiscium viviparus]